MTNNTDYTEKSLFGAAGIGDELSFSALADYYEEVASPLHSPLWRVFGAWASHTRDIIDRRHQGGVFYLFDGDVRVAIHWLGMFTISVSSEEPLFDYEGNTSYYLLARDKTRSKRRDVRLRLCLSVLAEAVLTIARHTELKLTPSSLLPANLRLDKMSERVSEKVVQGEATLSISGNWCYLGKDAVEWGLIAQEAARGRHKQRHDEAASVARLLEEMDDS